MTSMVEIAALIYVTAYFVCLWRTAPQGSLRIRTRRG